MILIERNTKVAAGSSTNSKLRKLNGEYHNIHILTVLFFI